ncbi:MAG: Uma2 family endonuclease [Saprospiraceae bacterium]|nr:Uma2 family endonuclease [Saprospiraceae bacterium]
MTKRLKIKDPEASYGKHYTYRDYLQFTFDEMVEIIKGKIFRMSPGPSARHQEISGNLFFQIKKGLNKKSCKIFSAPFDVILPVKDKDYMDSDRVVQPDIVVICDPEKIKERGCFGAPDWIIEILSPNTTKKDLQDKFDLYEESGVGEYWIAEPRNQTVEVFVLEQGSYKRIRTYVKEDEVASHTLSGLTIFLDKVFE